MTATKTLTTPGLMTAGYIRLTRDESLANGLSAPAQRKGINEYATRAALDPVVMFEETKAVAGDSQFDSRPAGRKLIEAIKNGEVGHLIVRDLDRLTRDILLSVELMDLCRSNRVQIHTFSGPVLLKSASDRFAYNVRSAASMFEKDQVSDRVTKAKRESVEQGRWPGGPPPYGYMTQAYRRSTLITAGMDRNEANIQACNEYTIAGQLYINPTETETVREIVRMTLDGLGSRRICHALNTDGHRTRTGVLWSTERLRRTLANPAMAGYLTYDTEAEDTGRVAPKQQQKLFKGNHEAIVTLEDWKTVRRIRAVNRSVRYDGTPSAGRAYLLTGVLRCQCGAPMRGKSSSKRHLSGWYVCTKRFYHGKNLMNGCSLPQSSLNAGRVHEVFWPYIQKLLASPDLVDRVFTAAQKIVQSQQASKTKAIDYAKAIAKVEADIEKWYERHDAARTDDAKEAAWNRVVALTSQKKGLEHERKHLPALQGVTKVTKEQIAKYLGSMFTLIEKHTPGEAKAFVQSLVKHHGLKVAVVGPETLAVSLAVKSPGTAADKLAVSGTVPIAGRVDMPKSKTNRWLEENSRGQHKCEQCGKPVKVVQHHYWRGIPKHHPKCWTQELARRRNHRDDGLLTGSALARLIGVGDSTICRWQASGKLPKPFKLDRGTKLWERSQVAHLL